MRILAGPDAPWKPQAQVLIPFFTTYGIREEQQYMRFYHGSRQEHTASDLQNSEQHGQKV